VTSFSWPVTSFNKMMTRTGHQIDWLGWTGFKSKNTRKFGSMKLISRNFMKKYCWRWTLCTTYKSIRASSFFSFFKVTFLRVFLAIYNWCLRIDQATTDEGLGCDRNVAASIRWWPGLVTKSTTQAGQGLVAKPQDPKIKKLLEVTYDTTKSLGHAKVFLTKYFLFC
jgi:hypothetical protein